MADFADIDAGELRPEIQDDPGLFSVLFTWVGALMSVALVVGLGMWAYQLAVRDVSGVPVVRALEGPMRIAPEDPGGDQAAHQGLAVNSVAAEGTAERPADRLVLAPAPLDLSDEDLPRPQLEETAAVETSPLPRAASREELVAIADALANGVTPLAGEQAAGLIPANVAGVSVSLVPRARPTGDLTAAAIATEVALAVARPTNEVDPGSIAAGTRMVQFGAYDTPEDARESWVSIETKFADFLRGKSRVVQEAVSGGKTFYRLRALNFEDINDARRFCAALVAERQACIPVVMR